ncbi:unnamed protein product [Rotaria magnacalcarata]|uniref:Reverse transcriptase domain-containing protein n=1 Tax=Rotaria magnacalcarata TaxID=392030 RepID=A0A816RGM2_9BILA|nr:unnamed protein product [Rotaria magnacalcarata]
MVDGHIYKGLIDSGAQVSLIALATVVNNHNFANVKHSELEIKGIGGEVKVLGEITLNMQVAKEVQMEQLFIVVESLGTDLLLGANFFIKNRIVLDLANKKVLQEEKNKVNLNKSINLNSDYHEIKLINTVNLKPQSSTVVAYTLNCNLNNNKLVANYGIFPDENKLDKDLLIASFIIDSKCEKFVVPIMNCSEKLIQVKANTVIGFAQKLNISDKGILSEVGHEWVPKEVNIVSNENESLADKFRMKETDLSETELTRVTELLNKFNTIVSKNDEDVGFTNTIQHRIELTKDTAIKQPIRRVTGELANEIEEILLKDEAAGIIRRSHSAWSSCIVPVKKKCGGTRLAIDYRRLNDLTVKDSFPLPNLTGAVYNLHGAKYFTTLDLTRGYYNVPMHEDSIHMTAFSTSRSHWEFVRMPFGLCNAGATFQCLMNLVLCGFRWDEVLCYIDDVLVLGSSFDEHLQRLHDVFECLANHGLKIKPSKCFLFRK